MKTTISAITVVAAALVISGALAAEPASGAGMNASLPVRVQSPDKKNEIALSLSQRGVELAVSRRGATQVTAVFVRQRYKDADDALAHIDKVNAFLKQGLDEKSSFEQTLEGLYQAVR